MTGRSRLPRDIFNILQSSRSSSRKSCQLRSQSRASSRVNNDLVRIIDISQFLRKMRISLSSSCLIINLFNMLRCSSRSSIHSSQLCRQSRAGYLIDNNLRWITCICKQSRQRSIVLIFDIFNERSRCNQSIDLCLQVRRGTIRVRDDDLRRIVDILQLICQSSWVISRSRLPRNIFDILDNCCSCNLRIHICNFCRQSGESTNIRSITNILNSLMSAQLRSSSSIHSSQFVNQLIIATGYWISINNVLSLLMRSDDSSRHTSTVFRPIGVGSITSCCSTRKELIILILGLYITEHTSLTMFCRNSIPISKRLDNMTTTADIIAIDDRESCTCIWRYQSIQNNLTITFCHV